MGKTSTTTQENNPPEWSQPLLETAAGDALDLYKSGTGYGVYTGPTQAGFSDPTLNGMNSLLAATGYKGAPVSNSTWQNNPSVLQAQDLLKQLTEAKATQQPATAAATAPAQYTSQKGEIPLEGGGMYYNGLNYSPVGEPKNGMQTYATGTGNDVKYLQLRV